MGFVTLWGLSLYGLLANIEFVTLWGHEVSRIMGLVELKGFVAYGVSHQHRLRHNFLYQPFPVMHDITLIS